MKNPKSLLKNAFFRPTCKNTCTRTNKSKVLFFFLDMDDVLGNAFREASTGAMPDTFVPGMAPAPASTTTTAPAPAQAQAPPPALLALVHFLLAVQAANPGTPEGLAAAFPQVPMPTSADEAAAGMERVLSIVPGKLDQVLGPVQADPSSSPRTMLQQLLRRAMAEEGTSVAKVSLYAVLIRWLQKSLSAADPGSTSALQVAAGNMDIIHSLSSSNDKDKSSSVHTGTPGPSSLKASSASGNASRKTIIIVSIVAVVFAVAALVLLILFLKKKPKSSAVAASTPYGGRFFQQQQQQLPPPAVQPLPPTMHVPPSLDLSSGPQHSRFQFRQPTFAPL